MDKATQETLLKIVVNAGKRGQYTVEAEGEEWIVLDKTENVRTGGTILYDCIGSENEARLIAALCNLGMDTGWDQIHSLVEALID